MTLNIQNSTATDAVDSTTNKNVEESSNGSNNQDIMDTSPDISVNENRIIFDFGTKLNPNSEAEKIYENYGKLDSTFYTKLNDGIKNHPKAKYKAGRLPAKWYGELYNYFIDSHGEF